MQRNNQIRTSPRVTRYILIEDASLVNLGNVDSLDATTMHGRCQSGPVLCMI